MAQAKAEFYRAEELAEMLKVNIMTIYRYIKSGKIQAHKIGKEFRIEKKSFDDFLKATKL
jgi:excisionase family DNA binding protein